jgi:hypothetical protein
VNTGNIEFAALFAPKPQGMTSADDWTKEMATKGFPELKQLYSMLGAGENVMLHRGEHFPHNYNAVSRSGFYSWLNKHFKLGFKEPVVEKDYDPLSRDQLTVWDDKHPAPKAADPDFERGLLKWLTEDAEKQLRTSAKDVESWRAAIGPAVEVLCGRTLATAGNVVWDLKNKTERDSYIEMTGLLQNKTHGEELPVVWLYPKQWNGRAVVWLEDSGKAGLYQPDGSVKPSVLKVVQGGATVVGVDLLYQGEFLTDGQPLQQTRKVEGSREFAGYTFGYNPALAAQRAHDVLSVVQFLRTADIAGHPKPSSIDLLGFGDSGSIAGLVRAVSGDAINRAAIGTNGFRFGKLLDYRSPQFLPGGAKYLDLPGILALSAPHKLWLAGEGNEPLVVADIYRSANATQNLTGYAGDASQAQSAAVEWLMK